MHNENFLGINFKKYREVLSKHYKEGFLLDKLSLLRFRMIWQNSYKDELQFDDDIILKHIKYITIQHGDKAYLPENILDENIKFKLLNHIHTLFLEGKTVIYYEALYQKFFDDFVHGRINDIEMLKAYLSYINDGSMHFHRSYITSKNSIEVDIVDEVRNFLVKQGGPVKSESIISSLSHIGAYKIRQVLAGSNSDEFVRNKRGEYFHVSLIEFTQQEINLITKWINNAILDKKYMGDKELIDIVQKKLPSITMERYPYLTQFGLRGVIEYNLKDKFSFNGKIVSSYDENLSMTDVFAHFAKTHKHFTLEQLNMLKNDLDTQIYFDVVYNNSLRINKDEFVSVDQAKFDIKATDIAIGYFFHGDFIAIKDVLLFAGFPDAYFSWNHFLLQHYVANYSKEYKLLIHVGFNAEKPVGAIVKKSSQINTFDDVIIRALAESPIVQLNINTALQYLFDAGYIARRNYILREDILIKARSYRTTKGK